MKTIKQLFKESPDQPLILLSYWATPLLWCGLSLTELCMGRQLRTEIPLTKDSLTPDWPFLEQFRGEDGRFKRRQNEDYDRRHRTRSLPDIPQGTDVWINTGGHSTEGVANPHTTAPRSYTVTMANGTLRRNRSHLNVVPPPVETATSSDQAISDPSDRGPIMTHARTGSPIIPLERL